MKRKQPTPSVLLWRKGQPIPSELAPVEAPKVEAPDDDPQPRERRDEPPQDDAAPPYFPGLA